MTGVSVSFLVEAICSFYGPVQSQEIEKTFFFKGIKEKNTIKNTHSMLMAAAIVYPTATPKRLAY